MYMHLECASHSLTQATRGLGPEAHSAIAYRSSQEPWIPFRIWIIMEKLPNLKDSSQGLAKSHAYGASPIGADPKATFLQKSIIATATGVLPRGTSRTLAIEWVYGTEGQPEIRPPLYWYFAHGFASWILRTCQWRPSKRHGA